MRLSKKEKRELRLSKNPLRELRTDLRNQGTTLEEFLDLCYSCGLNPLPMIREKGINIRCYKDVSYCDVSVSHEDDRLVLSYPDFESNWNMWCRFNDRYQELINLVDGQRTQKQRLNRPHRTVNKTDR